MTGRGWLDALIALSAGIGVSWLALVVLLARRGPKGPLLGEALRLLPDLIRLLARVAADRQAPAIVRAQILLLTIYLASPIDLVPDFVPVLGYVDDAILVAIVLRTVIRRMGLEAVRAHRPGTEEGLAALTRLAGLPKTASGDPSAPPR